jgi:hypothetical protein
LLNADGFLGLYFDVAFDVEHLTVVDVVPSTMASGCLFEWRAQDGSISVASACMEGLYGDGEYCRIVYEVLGFPPEGVCVLDLQNAQADERPDLLIMNDGAIVGAASSVEGSSLPTTFSLHAPVPNPSSPSINLHYSVPASGGHVSIRVHDISGREVATLHEGVLPGGNYTVEWLGRDARGVQLASGIYVVRLEAEGCQKSQKVTLLR